MESRISLQDTTTDAVIKLAEGNPGALAVCMAMLTQSKEIDPDSALGGLGALLDLDTLGIYGSRIWMLHKDVCKENLINTLGVLRGRQLGYVRDSQINHAIDNRGDGLDVLAVLTQVRERLPAFGLVLGEEEET